MIIEPQFFLGFPLSVQAVKCDGCCEIQPSYKAIGTWWVGTRGRRDIYGESVTQVLHLCDDCKPVTVAYDDVAFHRIETL